MDGVFRSNISYGMPVLEAINKHAKRLMSTWYCRSDRYIKIFFAELGANILSVHYEEACTHTCTERYRPSKQKEWKLE
jgi:ribulose-phosphate 3-epimerase